MKRKNNFPIVVTILLLSAFAVPVHADEISGDLSSDPNGTSIESQEISGTISTGLNATVGSVLTAVVISPPIASPSAGTYATRQSIVLTSEGAASIRYTVDETMPSCSYGSLYSGVITIAKSQVIKAISCYENGKYSTVVSYGYSINTSTSSSSGGGGGGGGGAGVYVPTCSNIVKPTNGFSASIADNSPSQGYVTLTMNVGSDTSRMAVSNSPSYSGVGIQTFKQSFSWRLFDDSSGIKTVYVTFYNACGSSASTSVTFNHQGAVVSSTSESHLAGSVLGEKIGSVTQEEITLTSAVDNDLARKLAGRILLQVERYGQAWYLDSLSLKRYYLENGVSAYSALRKFGLGITNENLEKIPVVHESRFEMLDSDADGLPDKLEEALKTNPLKADSDGDGVNDGYEVLKDQSNPLGNGKLAFSSSFANKLKGRILLQVESRGEAWYVNPVDGKRYYMANGDAAYQIMRYLSLGITNVDIRKIAVGAME